MRTASILPRIVLLIRPASARGISREKEWDERKNSIKVTEEAAILEMVFRQKPRRAVCWQPIDLQANLYNHLI